MTAADNSLFTVQFIQHSYYYKLFSYTTVQLLLSLALLIFIGHKFGSLFQASLAASSVFYLFFLNLLNHVKH